MLNLIISLILFIAIIHILSNLILKYIQKFYEISNVSLFILFLYISGLINSLIAFIPSLRVIIYSDPLTAFYMNFYNPLLDLTLGIGSITLLFGIKKDSIKNTLLIGYSLSVISLIISLIFGVLNLYSSIFLIISFILINSYIIIHYKRKRYHELANIDISWKQFLKIVIYSFIIGASFAIIFSYPIDIITTKLLHNYKLSYSFLGLLISLIVFTLPTQWFILISWKKGYDINATISTIIGESLFSYTIFTGILAGIRDIRFSTADVLPIFSSIVSLYIIFILLYLSKYYDIPKPIGIFIMILGTIIAIATII